VKRITNAKMSLRGEDEKLSMLQDTSIREWIYCLSNWHLNFAQTHVKRCGDPFVKKRSIHKMYIIYTLKVLVHLNPTLPLSRLFCPTPHSSLNRIISSTRKNFKTIKRTKIKNKKMRKKRNERFERWQ
jgi:hypothetical protein